MKNFHISIFVVVLILSFIGCVSDPANNTNHIATQDTAAQQAAEKARLDSIASAKTAAEALALEEAKIKAEQDSLQKEEEKRLALAEKEKKEKARKAKQRKLERERKKKKQASATHSPKNKPAPKDGPIIKFAKTNYNFGTVKEGELVKYEFDYTNVGTEDLIIMDAKVTCGCTAPGFSFFPLKPGLSSAISVSFNSANKIGPQRPEITIFTNGTPSKQILTLNGTVVTK